MSQPFWMADEGDHIASCPCGQFGQSGGYRFLNRAEVHSWRRILANHQCREQPSQWPAREWSMFFELVQNFRTWMPLSLRETTLVYDTGSSSSALPRSDRVERAVHGNLHWYLRSRSTLSRFSTCIKMLDVIQNLVLNADFRVFSAILSDQIQRWRLISSWWSRRRIVGDFIYKVGYWESLSSRSNSSVSHDHSSWFSWAWPTRKSAQARSEDNLTFLRRSICRFSNRSRSLGCLVLKALPKFVTSDFAQPTQY